MASPNTKHGDQELDGSQTAASDADQSLISEIAAALGVPESDPRVGKAYIDALMKQAAHDAANAEPPTTDAGKPEQQTADAGKPEQHLSDEEKQKITDYALTHGSRHEDKVKSIDGKDLGHLFTEYLPTNPGDPCSPVAVRTGEENPNGDMIVKYFLPGKVTPEAVVEFQVTDGVATVTKLGGPNPGSTGFKEGDSYLVPPSSSTAPHTPDPPSGIYGKTDHSTGSDSNSASSGSSNTGGTGSNSGDDPHHAQMPFTPGGSSKSEDGSNSSNDTSGSTHTEHKGGSNTDSPTDEKWAPGTSCSGGGELTLSNGEKVCQYTPPTQVEVTKDDGGKAGTDNKDGHKSDSTNSDGNKTDTNSNDTNNNNDGNNDTNNADGNKSDTEKHDGDKSETDKHDGTGYYTEDALPSRTLESPHTLYAAGSGTISQKILSSLEDRSQGCGVYWSWE